MSGEPLENDAEIVWLTPVKLGAGEVALGGVALVLTFGFPLFAEAAASGLGVRVFAAGLLAIGMLGALAGRSLARRAPTGRNALLFARSGLVLLPLAALALGTLQPLLGVPAVIQGALALLFLGSLRGGDSFIEEVIFWLVPVAPDFVRPYTRWLTLLWGMIFLGCAVTIAVLAGIADRVTWTAFTGSWMWLGMGVFSVAEFLVRKTYFRNYFHQGPFERLWARLFPAEATPMGRLSRDYIERMRRELGRHQKS